ncbi:MAG TPA: GNAT family N-acetyltransferase [Acidimicrobiales bacterium]|nr:GNAT family N-acetyltransferase [Acidimicrobiales bacterium]
MEIPPELTEHPSKADIDELEELLNEFNFATTGIRDGRELAIFERDEDGRMVAGLYGWTWGGTCEIDMLWLDASLRGGGKGSAMLVAAEQEARERGCTQVLLGSHGFQAPGFYLKHGYELIATVDDYPRGSSDNWFRKRL